MLLHYILNGRKQLFHHRKRIRTEQIERQKKKMPKYKLIKDNLSHSVQINHDQFSLSMISTNSCKWLVSLLLFFLTCFCRKQKFERSGSINHDQLWERESNKALCKISSLSCPLFVAVTFILFNLFESIAQSWRISIPT